MAGYMRQVCAGTAALGEERCESYRQLWLSMKNGNAEPLSLETAIGCPHVGALVEGEGGKPALRACGTCPGNPKLKVFHCKHPARDGDQVTALDCKSCPWRPVKPAAEGQRVLILQNPLPPGDNLAMTAAVDSLHQANPGRFLTAVDSPHPALWELNPHVISIAEAQEKSGEAVLMHYHLVHQSNQRAVHVLQGYCDFLAENLRVKVPLLTNRPMVYLSKKEKAWLPQVHELFDKPVRYWVLSAGYKSDCTAKFWGTRNFQNLVDALAGQVLFVQVGSEHDTHAELRGVVNLIGKTDLRQLMRLVYHADGAVGGVTMLMHLAAGFQKPYVCLAGGREPATWNAYPKQVLLHTVGALSCCRDSACWKSRVLKLGDGTPADTNLCEQPWPAVETIPRCMALITPEEVAAAVRRFLVDRP